MTYRVIFAPAADAQLIELFHHLADRADAETAQHYVDKVLGQCEALCQFPVRGVLRDDLMPGLRVTHYKRTAILFTIVDQSVLVLDIYHGGQDYDTRFLQ